MLTNERTNERINSSILPNDLTLLRALDQSAIDMKSYIEDCERKYLTSYNKMKKVRIKEISETKLLSELYQRAMLKELAESGVLNPNISQQKAIEIHTENITTKSPYVLLTVNPRGGITLKQFMQKIEKFVTKSFVKEYYYVYEVRNGEDGLHSHVIFRYTCRPYDLKKSMKTFFQDICDSSNYNILNYKFIPEETIKDKIDYLEGKKKESKQKSYNDTLAYRNKYKLKSCYESSPSLSCRATTDSSVPLIEEV